MSEIQKKPRTLKESVSQVSYNIPNLNDQDLINTWNLIIEMFKPMYPEMVVVSGINRLLIAESAADHDSIKKKNLQKVKDLITVAESIISEHKDFKYSTLMVNINVKLDVLLGKISSVEYLPASGSNSDSANSVGSGTIPITERIPKQAVVNYD